MKFEFNQKELILFFLNGLTSLAIYYLSLLISYDYFEITQEISISISFVISSCFNFLVNRNLTFNSKKKISKQIIKYSIMVMGSYIITMIITSPSFMHGRFNIYISSFLAIFILTIYKFLMSKHIVFKK
jgi:putative flippase GtrA